jgi:hypothetical protein
MAVTAVSLEWSTAGGAHGPFGKTLARFCQDFGSKFCGKLSIAPAARATTALSPSSHPSTAAKMKTQWKDIPVVPTSQEFLDIVLSRTYDFPAPRTSQCARG